VSPATLVDFAGAPTLGGHTVAVSLHAHTNRSREGMSVMPRYLEQIPLISALTRRELRAYERRNHAGIDFTKGWWCPPVGPGDVLASETSQIAGRLGLRPIVSITDHDSIEAPLALRSRHPRPDDVPLSVEWTVPFERGFLHLGVHNLPGAHGDAIFEALAAHTRLRDFARLTTLLDVVSADPETLVVLNHPLWDLAGIGSADHASLVRRFLDEHRHRIHALEVNGYRSWDENGGAIELARVVALPIVSGGDRHGWAPNALLNLTTATTFGAFAREIREERRSVVLVMPEYREALVCRKLAVASDALRDYPAQPRGQRRWTDRVAYERDGEIRRLSDHWPHGGPLWVRCATRIFAWAARAPLLPATRAVVWLAGASTSGRGGRRRAAPAAALPSPAAPYQEPIG
jgi:hypothetical protein